jgi:hypothetical protein
MRDQRTLISIKRRPLSESNAASNATEFRFWVELPVDAVSYLKSAAQSKAISVERLLQQLITEHVTGETRSLKDRMNHLNELVKELAVAVKNPEMLTKIAGSAAFEARQRKRDHIVELGLQALEEVSRISKSDKLAKESGPRFRAFAVLARVGAFTDAVIHHQDEADVEDLLMQIEEANEELQDELKKAKKERTA